MNIIVNTILSNNLNTMLAAIISLLLVVFFVSLLHCYAKRFLITQGSRRSLMFSIVPPILRARNDDENDLSSSIKGLESSVISSIPQFVFKEDEDQNGLESCVICLSLFEDGEKGRILEVCRHAFHVECIDMWLHSHTTCPICRAPAVLQVSTNRNIDVVVNSMLENYDENDVNEMNFVQFFERGSIGDGGPSRLEIVVHEGLDMENGSKLEEFHI